MLPVITVLLLAITNIGGSNPSPFWGIPGPVLVYQRPIEAMVDVTNDLGIAVLQDFAYTRSNFAFSPYGVASVLVVLYEGARGESARQIHNTLRLPWNRDITRIGFRDIHRHLRSYFSHEGYLSGLTLNKNQTSLLTEYRRVLRFYGYDVGTGQDQFPPTTTTKKPTTTTTTTTTESTTTESTTENIETTPEPSTENMETTTMDPRNMVTEEETTSEAPTITTSPSLEVAETTTEDIIPPTRTTEDIIPPTTITTTEDIIPPTRTTEDIVPLPPTTTTTTAEDIIPPTTTIRTEERVTEEPVTELPSQPSTHNEETTMQTEVTPTSIPETTQPIPNEMPEEATEPIEETPASTEPPEILTEPTQPPEILTEPTQPPEILTEPTQPPKILTEPTQPPEILTEPTQPPEILTEPTQPPEILTEPTQPPEILTEPTQPPEILTEPTQPEVLMEPTQEPNMSTESPGETTTETPKTTEVSALDEETTEPPVLAEEPMDQPVETMAPTEVPEEVETFVPTEVLEEEVVTVGPTEPEAEIITTQMIESTTESMSSVTEAEETSTQSSTEVSTSGQTSTTEGYNTVSTISPDTENTVPDGSTVTLGTSEQPTATETSESETLTEAMSEIIESRVKFNVPIPLMYNQSDTPSVRTKRSISDGVVIFPDISLQLQNGMFDSQVARGYELYTQLPKRPFLVDGVAEELVPVMSYTALFPFAYIRRLHAQALEFPLDDERYKLLLLLPIERRGLRQLIYDLSSCPLREIYQAMRPTRVQAIIPSFMVEGFVILTPTLQQLGIWDVFDPRRANLSGMSNDPDLYVRNIEQAVTVVIRNYVKILDIQTRTMAARATLERFVATHPFLYFVMDTDTHVALMAGKIVDPMNSRIY